jgi:hypothetical protein
MMPAMKRFLFPCLLLLLMSLRVPLRAQLNAPLLQRVPGEVTLQWSGGRGPFAVETNRGQGWSMQSELEAGRTKKLPSFGDRAFYRISDLDPAGALGTFFGLVQTTQGEFGELLGRHRLKSRFWFYRTKGPPHTAPSFTAADYFRKLVVFHQYHEDGMVRLWSGALESLGAVTVPTTQSVVISWSRGSGGRRQDFQLTLRFPYAVQAVRTAVPLPSDPEYTLRCERGFPEPEFDGVTGMLVGTLVDSVTLSQLDPANPQLKFPQPQQFRVSHRGATLDFHFHEGLPLLRGEPPMIWKTAILDRWLSPTVAGGVLPSFRTDSYFSQTLLPGHHSFTETMLLEPALDPSLSEAVRAELAARNIRWIYAFKDLMLGISPDEIRLCGFDWSVRAP